METGAAFIAFISFLFLALIGPDGSSKIRIAIGPEVLWLKVHEYTAIFKWPWTKGIFANGSHWFSGFKRWNWDKQDGD